MRCEGSNRDEKMALEIIESMEQKLARADARIAELEQAFSELSESTRSIATHAADSIARLETDLELARRDAERYRFLRDQVPRVTGDYKRRVAAHLHDWARSIDPNAKFNMWSYDELCGDRLDAEIDKARAGNGGGS